MKNIVKIEKNNFTCTERFDEYLYNLNVYYIGTGIDPEAMAALGASFSRNSKKPIEEQIEFFLEDGGYKSRESKNRIMEYFTKYGHGSIGDMALVCLVFENISELDAIRLISFPRFFGQAASTRYIFEKKLTPLSNTNFSILSYKTPDIKYISSIGYNLLSLYKEVYKDLMDRYLESMDESEAKPKALDIAGSILPTSTATKVFMIANVRDLREMVLRLKSYPTQTTKDVGIKLEKCLDKYSPNSKMFSDDKSSKLIEGCSNIRNFFDKKFDTKIFENKSDTVLDLKYFDIETAKEFVQENYLHPYIRLLDNTSLSLGTIKASFKLDFRSLRDLLRHRTIGIKYFLSKPYKFNNYYIDQMSIDEIHSKVRYKMEYLYSKIEDLENPMQYIPMGTMFNVEISGDLGHFAYLINLRSSEKVHPSLRGVILPIANKLANALDVDVNRLVSSTSVETDYSKRSKDK